MAAHAVEKFFLINMSFDIYHVHMLQKLLRKDFYEQGIAKHKYTKT